MRGREIRVRGQVQGVGFRPFVWRLARDMGLAGSVRNDGAGVLIALYGDCAGFEARLRAECPPLAVIDALESRDIAGQAAGFEIIASAGGAARTRVTPDAATCPDCLAEVRDPGARRAGYAFANCTHCGPRFTILRALPYDRAQTTMAPFRMCAGCRAEYEEPGDRRFHAQPIACAACGPRLWLEVEGAEAPGDPLVEAARRLRGGAVIAIKGLGGFHLACDATNPAAIATLRTRKHRPAKPFALMAPIGMIARHASISPEERARLSDPAAPILLLRPAGTPLPEVLAPGLDCHGWMLPATPLHHLLFDALDAPLVMTSGNLSGEPMAIGNDEAREKLTGFADALLLHDRDIARRLDDSVERITPEGPMVLRRARGAVPGTLPLPEGFAQAPELTAYGGQMKAAICLLKDGQALLGHHLGELEDALTYEAFEQAEADYSALLDHRPALLAADAHTGYRATQHAEARAAAWGLPLDLVQHHHAHLAACLGEAGWPLDGGPVAGIILDGTGAGADGTVWGGELLLGDYEGFTRQAWLRPAPLIGGEMAAREPWRNALVRLDQAGQGDLADRLFAAQPRDLARAAAKGGINAPLSSSAGRLFDAVAGCLGICATRQSFEGEAAMRLEALAQGHAAAPYTLGGTPGAGGEMDTAPLFAALAADLAAGQAPGAISARFHAALAQSFAAEARALYEAGEASAVALSGGCFQNARLLAETCAALQGVPLLLHHMSPANDGGLALGQALVAAARWIRRSESSFPEAVDAG